MKCLFDSRVRHELNEIRSLLENIEQMVAHSLELKRFEKMIEKRKLGEEYDK